jgi:hypothetical protein
MSKFVLYEKCSNFLDLSDDEKISSICEAITLMIKYPQIDFFNLETKIKKLLSEAHAKEIVFSNMNYYLNRFFELTCINNPENFSSFYNFFVVDKLEISLATVNAEFNHLTIQLLKCHSITMLPDNILFRSIHGFQEILLEFESKKLLVSQTFNLSHDDHPNCDYLQIEDVKIRRQSILDVLRILFYRFICQYSRTITNQDFITSVIRPYYGEHNKNYLAYLVNYFKLEVRIIDISVYYDKEIISQLLFGSVIIRRIIDPFVNTMLSLRGQVLMSIITFPEACLVFEYMVKDKKEHLLVINCFKYLVYKSPNTKIGDRRLLKTTK